MSDPATLVIALTLLSDIMLAASSRLLHCVKIIAAQGALIGLLPLLLSASGHAPSGHAMAVAAAGVAVKGALLPYLLSAAMRKAEVERELEPFIGYPASVATVSIMAAAAFAVPHRIGIAAGSVSASAVSAALATMATGLFMMAARRKALTQVIGFLAFENGVAVFGAAMAQRHAALVELGILLDVTVMVFIAGIAVFHISREFSHIDADRLGPE